MDDGDLQGFLRDEYIQLQKTVEEHDQRALTIKAWSVTFSSAGLVTSYVYTKPIILIVSTLSAVTFWIVEALWKINQQAFYPRILAIEEHFQRGLDPNEFRPFAISKSWKGAFKQSGQYRWILTIMVWPHVALPHAVIALAGVVLFVAGFG